MKLFASVAALVLSVSSALAATGNNPITPQTPNNGKVHFTSSSTAGTYVTLYTSPNPGSGSVCTGIGATNNDTVAHVVTLQVYNNSVAYGGAAASVAANSGFASGTNPVTLLNSTIWPWLPKDQFSNPVLILVAGDTLQATFATAITSGDAVNVYAICWDF